MNLSVQPRNLFTESEASGTGVQDQRMCSLMGPSVRTEDSLAKHRGLALNARSVSGKLRSIRPTSDSKTEGWKGRHPPAAHVLVLGAAAPPISSPGIMKHPQGTVSGPEQSWMPCQSVPPPQERPRFCGLSGRVSEHQTHGSVGSEGRRRDPSRWPEGPFQALRRPLAAASQPPGDFQW